MITIIICFSMIAVGGRELYKWLKTSNPIRGAFGALLFANGIGGIIAMYLLGLLI